MTDVLRRAPAAPVVIALDNERMATSHVDDPTAPVAPAGRGFASSSRMNWARCVEQVRRRAGRTNRGRA